MSIKIGAFLLDRHLIDEAGHMLHFFVSLPDPLINTMRGLVSQGHIHQLADEFIDAYVKSQLLDDLEYDEALEEIRSGEVDLDHVDWAGWMDAAYQWLLDHARSELGNFVERRLSPLKAELRLYDINPAAVRVLVEGLVRDEVKYIGRPRMGVALRGLVEELLED